MLPSTLRRLAVALLGPALILGPAALTAQSPAVALNPTSPAYDPLLVHSDTKLHACGRTAPNNTAGFIHYARSTDGGRTWPLREVPLAYAHSVNDFAVAGDLLVVLLGSTHLGPHTTSSFDGGSTWDSPVRLSSQNTLIQTPQGRMHLHGTSVAVIWLETRAGGGSIWANHSSDGGRTWQPSETRLDVGVSAANPSGSAYDLTLIGDGTLLHVLWEAITVTGPQVLRQRSTDGGATWLPQPSFVATGSMMAAGGDGNLLFVSRGSPLPDLRSTNGGASWTPISGMGSVGINGVAVDGLDVLAVSVSGVLNYDLRVNASRDGGTTWLPTALVLPSPLPLAATPAIAGDTMLVHGRYLNQPWSGGFVLQSDDFGVSWRSTTNDASLGLWAAPDRLIVTTAAPSASAITHAFVLAGHTTLGSGTTGTGGRMPELAGRGLPTLGRTFALEVTNALGNALGVLATSFAPPLPSPLGGATLWLQQPIMAHWFATTTAGTSSLQVTVPPSATIQGLSLTSQAFVLDVSAAGGFSTTAAVQSWLL